VTKLQSMRFFPALPGALLITVAIFLFIQMPGFDMIARLSVDRGTF